MITFITRVRNWRPGTLQKRVAVAVVSIATMASVALVSACTYTCHAVLPTPTFPLVYLNEFGSCGLPFYPNNHVFAFDTQPATAPTGVVSAQFPAGVVGPVPGGIGNICFDVSPAPALADRLLFTGSESGYIFALDTKDLALVWKYLLPANSETPVPGQEFLVSTPATANGIVYVSTFDYGACDHGITGLCIRALAYTRLGAKLLWSYPLPWNYCGVPPVCGLFWAQSSPTVDNGVVYIGSETGLVYAFDAATGKPRWTFKTNGFTAPIQIPVCSRPAVADGVVYVAGGDGYLYALDGATGGLLWSYNTGVLNTGAFICGSPAVTNGVVYFATVDGNVYALDARRMGAVLGHRTLPHHTHSSARVVEGTLYIGTDAGELYALDVRQLCCVQWVYVTTTHRPIDSTPAVDNGIVYFGSEDGRVYAVIPPRVCAPPGPSLSWAYDTGPDSPIMASPAFGP